MEVSHPQEIQLKNLGLVHRIRHREASCFEPVCFEGKKNIGSKKPGQISEVKSSCELGANKDPRTTKEGALCPKITNMNETGIGCI